MTISSRFHPKKLLIIAVVIVIAILFNSSKPIDRIKNLKVLIKEETKANEKKKLFSQKPIEEGLLNIRNMFTAASAAEGIHIKNHNTVLHKLDEPILQPESRSIPK